jgi:hypothetical protein
VIGDGHRRHLKLLPENYDSHSRVLLRTFPRQSHGGGLSNQRGRRPPMEARRTPASFASLALGDMMMHSARRALATLS